LLEISKARQAAEIEVAGIQKKIKAIG